MNLGEVYLSLNELDKAEAQYLAILKLRSENDKDRKTINNFSQACYGLARVAVARKNSDEAVRYLQQAIEMNPQSGAALNLLAKELFERGDYREGERCLWALLAGQPPSSRRTIAEQFGGQFETSGKAAQAVRAWNFLAWAFATSPAPPGILDPSEAMKLAQHVAVELKQQDPLSLDTYAAALAATGQYPQAAQCAEAAVNLAKSQNNRPLGDAISQRLQFYRQGKPYRCDPNGGDRP